MASSNNHSTKGSRSNKGTGSDGEQVGTDETIRYWRTGNFEIEKDEPDSFETWDMRTVSII